MINIKQIASVVFGGLLAGAVHAQELNSDSVIMTKTNASLETLICETDESPNAKSFCSTIQKNYSQLFMDLNVCARETTFFANSLDLGSRHTLTNEQILAKSKAILTFKEECTGAARTKYAAANQTAFDTAFPNGYDILGMK